MSSSAGGEPDGEARTGNLWGPVQVVGCQVVRRQVARAQGLDQAVKFQVVRTQEAGQTVRFNVLRCQRL